MRAGKVLEKVESTGLSVNIVRLMDWANAKLIPVYGGDELLDYSDEVWWQAVAAGYLLDTCGFSVPEVRIGRFYMEDALVGGGSPVAKLDRLASAVGRSIQHGENYWDSFAWTVACIKAKCDWPLIAPANITVRHGAAGPEYQLEQSFEDEDSLQEDGLSSRHPQHMFVVSSADDEE